MVLTIILLALFAVSFSCSLSESALTTVSDHRLRKLYNKHGLLKAPINLWIRKPYRMLISILVANTFANVYLSALSASAALQSPLPFPREVKEAIVWLVVTVALIVFSEYLPKVLGKKMPEMYTKYAILPVYVFQFAVYYALFPVFFLLDRALRKESAQHITYLDEVQNLARETEHSAQTPGTGISKDLNELFQRATRFTEVRVRDIMTPRDKVQMVNVSGRTFQQVVDDIVDTGRTRVPLYDGSPDNVTGFSLVKDLFYLCSSGQECTLADIMHPILEVPGSARAKDLLQQFRDKQIHIAKVVDDNHRFAGIITLEDVIEEIIGDILDEYDIRTLKR